MYASLQRRYVRFYIAHFSIEKNRGWVKRDILRIIIEYKTLYDVRGCEFNTLKTDEIRSKNIQQFVRKEKSKQQRRCAC